MAQLNDLLVLGNAKLINGLGILGTLNADSILPNITDTYVLGESGKRWKSAHIKSLVSDDINVTNYATIGAGQAATGTNTGALRVSGGLSTTQKSYFGAEIATNSTITSSLSTSTHLAGNKGTAIINSTAGGAGYNMLAKMNSTNGVWTLGGWTTGFYLFYTANSVITAGTNSYTKQLKLLDESGNSSFPGTVIAPTFSGALSGNASTATTLQTARTINGTSFNGSANITTANWGTARTLTIGNTGKSVNGAGNVSWSLSEIGALPTTGGTMSGDISFATIASWPTVSGETYPIESKGLYWSGSSDLVKLFYRVVSSDGGKFIIQLGDSTDEEVIVENTAGTVYAKIGNGGVTANNFYGNATSATYLKDKTNGTASYLNYGSSGMSSASWYGAWDGYTLRAISPANLATHLATTTLDARYVNINGDSMTGTLSITPPYQATASSRYHSSALEIREAGGVTSNQSDIGYAPRIGFHWGGRVAASLAFHSDGAFYFRNQADSGQAPVYASTFYGALSGNATTATTLKTARTFTIGNTGKSFNGSSNVSWTLAEIGAVAKTGDTMTGALNLANGTWNKAGDDAQFGDNNTAGSFAIQGINGNTNLKMVTYGGSSYGTITWNGSSFVFSNTISGTLDGTASSAHYAARARHLESPDTRAVVINPSSLSATTGVQFDFKQASAIGLSSDSYSGVMSYRPYSSSSDWTGGPAHQIAYNKAGLYWRQSSNDTTWGAWRRIMTSANFSLSGTTLTITTT